MDLPAEMLGIDMRGSGGPEVLYQRTFEVPKPGPGEVLIRVAAAGVNAPDLQQRRGRYDPPPGASPILGLEVSGEIVALGDGAARYALGERVVALCNGGGYTEFVAVPEGQVLPLPVGWSLIAGAALPETYFTVEQTLVMRAGLMAGMTVLVHGAAGGLGGAAIAIAKVYGAHPIAVVSSPEKAAYALSLGAVAAIDRTQEDFVTRTRELTEGRGADRILDIVGAQNLGRNFEAAAIEAHIVLLATLGGTRSEINAGLIVSRRLTLHGSTLRPQSRETKAAVARSLGEKVWPALSVGAVTQPRIRSFRLEEAVRAHQAMEEHGHFGKVVMLTRYGEGLA